MIWLKPFWLSLTNEFQTRILTLAEAAPAADKEQARMARSKTGNSMPFFFANFNCNTPFQNY